MGKLALAVVSTWSILFLIPIAIYGTFSAVWGLQTPEGVPAWQFLLGVAVSKSGTAVTFVLIYHLSRKSFARHWLRYALLWWLMFVVGEIGQAIGPQYTWMEALAGVISETIYFPLSGFITHRFLRIE